MSTKRFLKGASLVTASQLLVAACSFFRNIIISRHISVEDFGIAVIFALVVTLLEMTSYLALDNFLVQNEEGGSPAMLASAHALQFARGLAGGILLYLLATPIAHLFKVPDLVWAFQLLGLLPVVRGLVHYDMIVRKRDMDFRAAAIVDALPSALSLLVAWLASLWLRDYRVMLAVVFAEATLRTICAHALAHRPYRWSFKREHIDKKLRFGWPLLVNGLLMFGIFQGDRAVVGALFDLKTLGWFGAAFSLVLMPGLLFARICGNLLGPGLARTRNDPELYWRECVVALALCFACAAFISMFFAISGKAVMLLAFGHRYAEATDILLLLAVAQAIRIIRVAPSMISTSQARTTNAMFANLVRILGLPVAAGLALLGFGIEWVATSAIVGEAMATLVSFRILHVDPFRARFMRLVLQMSAAFAGITLVGFGLYELTPDEQTVPVNLALIAVGGVASVLAAVGVAALDGVVRQRGMSLLRGIRKLGRNA